MAKVDAYAEDFKRYRRLWGLILVVVWLLWWWFSNSADADRERAALPVADGLLSSGSNALAEAKINTALGFQMLVAAIFSPLMFVVSNYAARFYVDHLRKADAARLAKQQRDQAALQAAELDRVRRTAHTEAEKSQLANQRHELITRIGDVDAQLLVYETEKDQERRTRLLLNLTQFVYEIHAKFPAERLATSLASDPALRKMIENTLAHMRALGLQDKNFFAVLAGLLPDTVPQVPQGALQSPSVT